jgi:cellulose synthase/poly-beta-1,6-N-acetylglucosamine synthase-like glycosyltransferase
LAQIRLYTRNYPHVANEEELRNIVKSKNRNLPLISIIAPAYNEGPLIIESVKSFLNQSYPNTEVIVSSDGSTDDTLEKMIEYFELYDVDFKGKESELINHQPIKRYFKSKKNTNLIVIDKENGGKSDAQNAAISLASGEIIATIDADSVLEKNALMHIASIFERDEKTVGLGTPIGVVNDSNIGPDGVEDASYPKSFWAKIQVIEYLRAFLLGRMAIQKLRGLLIISGAFGVYQKWILEAVGGYTPRSLAEDMDIDCKIWKFIDHNQLKLTIRYIPEVFCWTQVPDTFKVLRIQRDRWARGLTATMIRNRDLFLNFRYKLLGLFSYPYYLFFEWLTPFIEILGLLYLILLTATGSLEYLLLGKIFLIFYTIGLILNIITITVEAFTGGHYKNSASLRKLALAALIEPIFYHWINSFFYLQGNINLVVKRSKKWGKMERRRLRTIRMNNHFNQNGGKKEESTFVN